MLHVGEGGAGGERESRAQEVAQRTQHAACPSVRICAQAQAARYEGTGNSCPHQARLMPADDLRQSCVQQLCKPGMLTACSRTMLCGCKSAHNRFDSSNRRLGLSATQQPQQQPCEAWEECVGAP